MEPAGVGSPVKVTVADTQPATHGRDRLAIRLSIFRARILQVGMASAVVDGF